jgi:hypothetical protein
LDDTNGDLVNGNRVMHIQFEDGSVFIVFYKILLMQQEAPNEQKCLFSGGNQRFIVNAAKYHHLK